MIDILLNSNKDPKIMNGDFAYGESTRQHQELILISEKGEWRENPLTGVGIRTELQNETTGSELLTAIKREFEKDGMTVLQIKAKGGNITTEAIYE